MLANWQLLVCNLCLPPRLLTVSLSVVQNKEAAVRGEHDQHMLEVLQGEHRGSDGGRLAADGSGQHARLVSRDSFFIPNGKAADQVAEAAKDGAD